MHILSSSQASLLPINTALKALFTAVTNTGWAGYVLLLTTVTAFADTATTAHAIDQDAAYHVSGLSQPAHIIVDEWGVPHLYAKDHYDVFFVQGFNAARDRLWQIDLWRRRGLGLLSEVLGSAYAEQDRAARLFCGHLPGRRKTGDVQTLRARIFPGHHEADGLQGLRRWLLLPQGLHLENTNCV